MIRPKPQVIYYFRGAYEFLSNFYHHPMYVDELHEGDGFARMVPTLEHAFQAAKATNKADALRVACAPTPGQSKRYGRNIEKRDDWEDIKEQIMLNLLRIKFKPGSDLAKSLLQTRMAELIEGNTWSDFYWGICNGKGKNRLGHRLMQVRAELRVRIPK